MPGFFPATGTTIAMGRVRNALNLSGSASIHGTLGQNRKKRNPTTGNDDDDPTTASNVGLSSSFGGRPYPGTY